MQSKNGHDSKSARPSKDTLAANDAITTREIIGTSDDIAIIGMACRFPGGVMNPQQYWEFLLTGGDGIVPIPGERWDSKAYYDPDRAKKNRMYVERGGFIGGLDQFDPIFFGISPAEANQIDPQHRWLLEVTYEALENAGLSAAKLRGSDTAVYIGQFMHDYEQLQLDGSAHGMITSHSATGPSMTLTANRISYVFDFRGPSVSLDTACSSSLVALDLACKALLHGDAELAVAGGVNLLLRPELTMAICKASMLSPDGRCKSFDASANGYVRSEGAGVVLVKRLSEAVRDGNQIWAVIRASGVNQDGHTVGITVPSGAAQEALLRRSLQRAALRGHQIQYAEAHGTGTAVGDPIEVNALGAVLGEERPAEAPFILGSVKSNIGHLESAAGVAGLIKTVLALNHGVIPQNLHYETINPKIDLQALNCRVADRQLPWPETGGERRRAIVNSFGFGGTNANVIVEQAPARVTETGAAADTGVNGPIRALVLSAKTEAALLALAQKYLAFIDAQQAAGEKGASLHEICYSAACAREHHKHRLAVIGASLAEVRGELERFLQGVPSPSRVHGAAALTSVSSADASARLCFVYSGMGTQWLGMGRELYATEPVFRQAFDRCSLAFEKLSGWSLTRRILEQQDEPIDDTAVAQPAIFTIQVALTALLESWGVRPSAVVGHSAGEVCAAYAAGALSFEDSVLVAYHRSRLQAQTEGTGTMLAVGLREGQIGDYLRGIEDCVSVAAINSQDAITLSGERSALERIHARLEAEGVFARFLNVGVPYHSPVMDRLEQPLLQALREIRALEPRVALYSTVSGKRTQTGDWTAEYWFRNVRQPVLFQAAIESMERDGSVAFLEVSPHAALASSVQKNIERLGQVPIVASTSKRNTDDALSLTRAMAALHVQGSSVSWDVMYARGGRLVTLPNYAWQHAAYWYESEAARRARLSNVARSGNLVQSSHPLAGARLNSGSELWQNNVDLNEQAYLADHQLDGEPVFPAAGYVEMALLLAKRAKGEGTDSSALVLEDLDFTRVLFLDRERATPIEMSPAAPGARELVIRAFDSSSSSWSVHSTATISDSGSGISNHAASPSPARAVDLNGVRERCGKSWERGEFYEHCHRLGLSYRGFFQVVTGARFDGDEVLTELSLPEALLATHADYLLHPVLLDGGFQGLFAVANQGYVPVRIAELRYHRRPPTRLYCHIRITNRTATGITGDVTLLDEQGVICVEVIGMESTATARPSGAEQPEAALLYAFDWRRYVDADIAEGQAASATAPGPWIVLADADDLSRGGDAQAIAAELAAAGQEVTIIVPETHPGLVANAGQTSSLIGFDCCADGDLEVVLQSRVRECQGIVFARSLGAAGISVQASSEQMLGACRDALLPALHLAQALGRLESTVLPRVYFVTRSAQRVDSSDSSLDPTQSALWGFVRVFGSEYPACSATLVDTDGTPASVAAFVRHLRGGEYEQELAFREGVRFANRLRALHEPELADYAREPYLRARGPFTWTGSRPSPHAGTTEQTLVFQRAGASAPTAGQANVAINCAVLSKLELEGLLAANSDAGSQTPGRGYACVATVTELPTDYTGQLRVGDQVVGFVDTPLGSHGQAQAELLVRKPEALSDAEAALLPTAWLSAWYAVSHVARLRADQTLFLYEPSGAGGLAAAQLARLLGVRVLASSCQELVRERLTRFGVELFDSRSP
ncbi:MAG TPA: beta-ketoacyl synthase N-terminal-like domain-containing protein, partial [Polyangiaceae bacterium]|nr:beta-ketoacyl synthase N-terminal-like domain-containing protein [Polyangiaceae bacterium]